MQMCERFILVALNNSILISNENALKLEIKLNHSLFSNKWKKLGDILYDWRIDSKYYVNDSPSYFLVSEQQFKWLSNTLSNL